MMYLKRKYTINLFIFIDYAPYDRYNYLLVT